MHKHLTRLFFGLLLGCLFLPFVPQGCDNGQAITVSDSTDVGLSIPVNDSIMAIDSAILADTISITNQNSRAIEEGDSTCNEESKIHQVFKFIVSPDKQNLSGIGYVIIYYSWIVFNSSLVAILLTLVIGLILSTKDYHKWSMQILKLSVINFSAWLLIVIVMHKTAKMGIWAGAIVSLINLFFQIMIKRKIDKTSS